MCPVRSLYPFGMKLRSSKQNGLLLFADMRWRTCSRVGSSSSKSRYPSCSLSNSWRLSFVTKKTHAADTQHGSSTSEFIPTQLLAIKKCAYTAIGKKLAQTRISIKKVYLQCFQNYSKTECKSWDFTGSRIQQTFAQWRLYQPAPYTASVGPVLLWRLLKMICRTISRFFCWSIHPLNI